jgi:hypothetical protein
LPHVHVTDRHSGEDLVLLGRFADSRHDFEVQPFKIRLTARVHKLEKDAQDRRGLREVCDLPIRFEFRCGESTGVCF